MEYDESRAHDYRRQAWNDAVRERRRGEADRRASERPGRHGPREAYSHDSGPNLHRGSAASHANEYEASHDRDDAHDYSRRQYESGGYDPHHDPVHATGTGYGGYGDAPGEGAAGFGSGRNYAAEPGWGPGYGEANHHRGEWPRSGYPDAGRSRSFGRPSVDDRGRADIEGGAEAAMRSRSKVRGSTLRGPKGYRRSDERIRDDICERLVHRGEHIDASEVSVDVKEGIVTLQGAVPERQMKHAIEDLVDDCMGVSEIDNRIRVTYAEHHAVRAPQEPHSEGPSLSIGSAHSGNASG